MSDVNTAPNRVADRKRQAETLSRAGLTSPLTAIVSSKRRRPPERQPVTLPIAIVRYPNALSTSPITTRLPVSSPSSVQVDLMFSQA